MSIPELSRKSFRTSVLVVLDIIAILSSMLVTYFFLYPIEFIENVDRNHFVETALLYSALFIVMAGISRLYRVAWRFASMSEAIRLAMTLIMSTLTLYALQFAVYGEAMERMLFLSFCLSLLLLGGIRLGSRIYVTWKQDRRLVLGGRKMKRRKSEKRTLIVGAGQAGRMLVRQINQSDNHRMNPVGFIDDNSHLQNLTVNGVRVLGTLEQLESVVESHAIDKIVFAIPSMNYQDRLAVIKRAKSLCTNVHTLPMIEEVAAGKVAVNQMRQVSIDDLLGREPVELDISGIQSEVEGKTILVTGAGGSIGSEICRQILKFSPERLLLLGHGENSIYLIERELRELNLEVDLIPVIADVQDVERLREVFMKHSPHLVFHAAAHKHVPLMEANPHEAVKNNIYGTKNVAEMADEFGSDRFVMISTDKAVNPTNVMGSTKRIAEMVVQNLAKTSETKYAIVRFGNVLGSRGSVIPLFKTQIEKGGPVTVTHPDMTRYFMTIPEASRLVIQAGILADGGEVFVLDMGEPVKIVDLARNMIKLSGFTEEQISIKFSGIRPGEKMFEELLKEGEVHKEAVYPKIFMGIVTEEQDLKSKLSQMYELKTSEELRRYLIDWANDCLDQSQFNGVKKTVS
ncbi:polysaccharide biosynthesis protein [Exiguobacterium mexicanum]|uniref:Nucleoside-diphosphate sugar epimerase/dehydratase n=1 Tax=Exiguobacterium mexicanum TaxID=340146 RepID=A0ABT7MMD6_9BACL|nr:nucleoside-diphosphate sugar epimerase/dehydratase [Exiguobacterium mexicanum]MDL5376346.1 nucleoside-diphosphate sugar epimerase/dehydratase [Exiguobacterium mexicanum]